MLMLAACGPFYEPPERASPPCRPAGAPPGRLTIGDLVFTADEIGVHVRTGGAALPGLVITLPEAGRTALARLTREGLGRTLTFAIDGETVMAPIIASEISMGEIEITGDFTGQELAALAARLAPACPSGAGR